VPTPVPFTDNYTDHSTEAGFQFEFFCERCGNGYKSGFKANPLGMGAKVARGLGGILGGRFYNAGYGADQLHDMTESAAKDKALQAAVTEVAPLFNQCHRCGQWVCKEICWNTEFNMCVNDAPKVEQEIGVMQSQARLEQLKTKVEAADWTGDINAEQKQRALCPHCGAEASPSGKFCENCGQKLTIPVVCAKCGTESERGTKFCPECGNNLLQQV
jgi:hypothetical protein